MTTRKVLILQYIYVGAIMMLIQTFFCRFYHVIKHTQQHLQSQNSDSSKSENGILRMPEKDKMNV